MRLDWTVNPGYLVTWTVLILTLIWKLGAFVNKLETMIQQFAKHEQADDTRFRGIDDRLQSLGERIDDLRERVPRGK